MVCCSVVSACNPPSLSDINSPCSCGWSCAVCSLVWDLCGWPSSCEETGYQSLHTHTHTHTEGVSRGSKRYKKHLWTATTFCFRERPFKWCVESKVYFGPVFDKIPWAIIIISPWSFVKNRKLRHTHTHRAHTHDTHPHTRHTIESKAEHLLTSEQICRTSSSGRPQQLSGSRST